MSETVTTVGIYLTQDEREHLTRLATDLEIREEMALRCHEDPEAAEYAAQAAALRKLMYLPASIRDGGNQ